MAGMTLRILPYQEIDTGGSVPTNTTMIVQTIPRIDASRFKSGILTARLHAVSSASLATWPASSSVEFEIGPEGFIDDDPREIWTMPDAGAVVTFSPTDTTPTVRTGSIENVLGKMFGVLRFHLKLKTAGTAGQMKVRLSADLTLRES